MAGQAMLRASPMHEHFTERQLLHGLRVFSVMCCSRSVSAFCVPFTVALGVEHSHIVCWGDSVTVAWASNWRALSWACREVQLVQQQCSQCGYDANPAARR
jgi:hypothetical protein